MEKVKVDVIIPTFRPGKEFSELLKRLEKQDYPIHKILIMNTEEKFWDKKWENCSVLEVHHLKKEDFDHGGTRKKAAGMSDGDILVFMTQDAVPADRHLIRKLITPVLEKEKVGASYARQLPDRDCNVMERYTRQFNYPEQSSTKRKEDLSTYGIKTYFCSNVCAAYSGKIFRELGGFVDRTIFNEDMIYAGTLIQHGYEIAYEAEARVIHSHNYTCMQQFHRNFDLGVSQAEHPEIFAEIPSEGEGMRLVKKTMLYLIKSGRFYLVPKLILQSGCKYAGYKAGKNYRKLPEKILLWCTMNKDYWR